VDLKGKKLLVIGGAGLIGSHAVDELVKEDVAEIKIRVINEQSIMYLDMKVEIKDRVGAMLMAALAVVAPASIWNSRRKSS